MERFIKKSTKEVVYALKCEGKSKHGHEVIDDIGSLLAATEKPLDNIFFDIDKDKDLNKVFIVTLPAYKVKIPEGHFIVKTEDGNVFSCHPGRFHFEFKPEIKKN